MRRQLGEILLAAALIVLFTHSAFAKGRHSDNDRASFASDITVAEGETVGDVACAFCSVHVHGDVTGDIAVAFGSVTVDSGRTISGAPSASQQLSPADAEAILGALADLHFQSLPRAPGSFEPSASAPSRNR